MAEKHLDDLFQDTLKDIYFAEMQILESLPKMAEAAKSKKLQSAFMQHHKETQGQIKRLEKIFGMLNQPAQPKTCDAIKGIIKEDASIIKRFEGSDALDAGLIADGQAVEHYEMARYGALRSWASQLGLNEAADLLGETFAEEKKTDELLTELAEAEANRKAA